MQVVRFVKRKLSQMLALRKFERIKLRALAGAPPHIYITSTTNASERSDCPVGPSTVQPPALSNFTSERLNG